MAGGLLNTHPPSLGTRREAAQLRAALHGDRLDLQFVDIRTIVMLGVGNGRFQDLLDDVGRLFGREREGVECLLDSLAANEVSDEPALLGGQPNTTKLC